MRFSADVLLLPGETTWGVQILSKTGVHFLSKTGVHFLIKNGVHFSIKNGVHFLIKNGVIPTQWGGTLWVSNLLQKGVRSLDQNLEVLNDFGQKGGPKSGSESGSKKVIPWCQTMDISIGRPDRPDRPDRGSIDRPSIEPSEGTSF